MKLAVAKPLTAPSGGTGGPLEDAKNLWFSASHGYSAYYHRYVSHVDWNKPVGLMFWFHGDGGYEFKNPDDPYYLAGPDGVIAQARKHNAVLIVPATPDDGADRWTWWKWGSKTSNPQYAKELFTHITSQYNVDMYRVWLCGFSGGAEFLSLYLLRHWGNEMGIKGGGCLLIGGGTKPPVADDFPASYKDNWVWEWRVGELDTGKNADGTTAGDGFDALAAAKGGEQWYRDRGWKTTLEIVPGKGHLMPQFYGELVRRSLESNPVTALGLAAARAAYFEGIKVKEIWHMGRRVYSSKPVEVMPPTPGDFDAINWLRGKLSEYGLDYKTVTELPFDIDSRNATTMRVMFADCSSLTTAPKLDTRNVTTMLGMFQNCSSLTSVPQMDTSQVTDMSYMFTNCSSLTTVPKMDTSKVTDMRVMFNYCKALTTVPELDTRNVTNMSIMFQRCESLTTVPQMDTRNVADMSYMFTNASSITRIPDLATSQVTGMTNMFNGCARLTDGNVRLVGKHPQVTTNGMITGSGLTREPFLTIE